MKVPKPSPALVVAGVALVLASSGTTLAASRYLISSTSQIKPSVLRSLASSARGEINEVQSKWAFSKPGQAFVWSRAACPEGTHVLSGGYEASLEPGFVVQTSQPVGNGWSVVAVNTTSFSASDGQSRMRVHALCASPTP